MPDNVLNGLSGIRLYDNWVDRVEAVDKIIKELKNHFRKIKV